LPACVPDITKALYVWTLQLQVLNHPHTGIDAVSQQKIRTHHSRLFLVTTSFGKTIKTVYDDGFGAKITRHTLSLAFLCVKLQASPKAASQAGHQQLSSLQQELLQNMHLCRCWPGIGKRHSRPVATTSKW